MANEQQFPSPYQMYPYLTDVPLRRPRQKLHENLGHAKNSVAVMYGYDYDTGQRTVRGGQIYEWNPLHSQWELIYDVAYETPSDKLPWK